MKKILVLTLFIQAFRTLAQENPIKNFEWMVNERKDKIVMTYELLNRPSPCYKIIVKVINNGKVLYPNPKNLQGHFGDPVLPGPANKIEWSWNKEIEELKGETTINLIALSSEHCADSKKSINDIPPLPHRVVPTFAGISLIAVPAAGLIAKGTLGAIGIINDHNNIVSELTSASNAVDYTKYSNVKQGYDVKAQQNKLLLNQIIAAGGGALMALSAVIVLKRKAAYSKAVNDWKKNFAIKPYSLGNQFIGAKIIPGITLDFALK